MKKCLITTCIVTTGFMGLAQYDAPITQFQSTLMQTNPAMTGYRNKHEANVLYQDQPGNRHYSDYRSVNANYAMRLDSINSGIGVSYSYNEDGFSSTHTAMLHYAYHFRWRNSGLSLGASAGVRTLSYNTDWIAPQTPNDPYLISGEFVPQLNLNTGIAYHWKDLNVGFSVTQVNEPKFKDRHSNLRFDLAADYWLFADYTFHLSPSFELRPQVQFSRNSMYWNSALLSVIASYEKKLGIDTKFFLGVNCDPKRYVGPMIGIGIDRFRLTGSYNFDIVSNDPFYYDMNNTSVEIGLSYQIK